MRKNNFHKGKTFYSILGLLVVFINVPILIALLFTQRTLEHSHASFLSVLGALQETQMQYIQEANPGQSHTDQLLALQAYPVLKELGEADELEYGAEIKEAENILLSVTPSSEFGQITTYLYFTKSKYLIDSSDLGGNAVETVDPLVFSGFDGLDSSYTEVPRNFLYSVNGQGGEEHSLYTAAVFPNVIFIFDIYFYEYPNSSRPDMLLSEKLTASLRDVEVCYYDSYGNVRAISGNGELIYQYDYDTIGPDCNHYFPFRYNGHFYLCHYVFKENNMTKFALFCRDEIAEEQHRTSILIWVSSSILLVAFLACAILYTRHAYRPMGSLMTRLTQGKNEDSPLSRNEFEVLNEAIDSFDDRLSKRDHLLSKYYLLRVLRGQRADILEDYQDDWFSDESGYSFAVAALHVDEFQGSDLYDESQLENTVTAFFKAENWDIRMVSDSDFLYIAFRLPREAQDAELMQAFQRLQKQLSGYYISVYISDIHTCARELRRCYNEAMAVSEYYIANEKISIIANNATTPQASLTRGTVSPDFGQLRKLSDCIAALSVEEALRVFDDLTFQLVQMGGQPLTAESPLYNLLVNTIALAVYDIDIPGDVGKSAIQQHVNLIRGASGGAPLRLQLQECLQSLSKKSDGQEYDHQRFEKIRDYIQEHYSDPNLDSASIAEHYNMSPSTITRLFKKYNNTGFLEYVHQTRVKKATELLQNTDLPISEISARVGYTNAATMNRAFKAHAKSTPSMIRKRALDEKSQA